MPPIFTEKLVNKIAYYKVGWEMLWNPENNVGSLAFLNQGQCRIQKPFQYFSHVLKLLSNAAEKPSSERQLPSHDRNAISRLSPCCASFRDRAEVPNPGIRADHCRHWFIFAHTPKPSQLGAPCATSSTLHFHLKLPATAWHACGAGTAASQLPDQTPCTARTTWQAKLFCLLPAILAL